MSNKRVIVFIDGNNWYHNVKKWVSKPSDIDFWKLSKFIAKKFDLDVVEIRYYNSVPSLADGQTMYYRHMEYLSDLKKEGLKVTVRKLQRNSTKEIIAERKEIIGLLDLCKVCKPAVETAFIDSLGTVLKKEKGIDVKIAVDMIAKCLIEEECDCCILLSGDADFIPSMELIKRAGKEVIISSVPMGFSSELRSGNFRYLVLGRGELSKECIKSYKEIKK
ncbi:NYN domain-containing protein [Candidatus Pacearchaeota archaeon]|nr:NYN domain-containing protein [Candidatus Pacearchaeota archaeon]